MPLNGSVLISDSTLLLRNIIASGVTDPVSSSRTAGESFVLTSYPQRNVRYPIISVKSTGPEMIRRLGMQSEDQFVRLPFEIRVWARNQREKDELAEQVYTWLRTNQFSGVYSTVNEDLLGFKINNMTNVDEIGVGAPKSKILDIEYTFIAI